MVKDDRGVTALLVNGKADANNADDMETQVNLANVPMLLHPSPRRVAVVGLGSGVTAGTAALYPGTARIDIVEIKGYIPADDFIAVLETLRKPAPESPTP